ncbi:Coenzyme F420 hydrogenase/dehydrogenase, beta subunit C-terminal domain [Eubacterium oxidoreducens]|uniref:Coenzyme F420-reducing hydrogenase, beta subunit n=1 Tax=Eubacterium oxidoreducens TaxID=1732 RepID=A0A1G6B4P0_EUBOX|nr:Coenzyme F420 hydrogenase/dehydrogenase, beta subunit C-terminal domain [Eubacterium oxidoreducens]SDB15630.1 Coenzyme F420-reducing hydrogenase, beta subunit [Eubacterium oxidoreducens]
MYLSGIEDMNVIDNLASELQCTGCMACVNRCDYGALTEIVNHDGFITWEYNADRCVECEKCIGVCPITHPVKPHKIQKIYAAFNKEEAIQMKSSSGGIAYALGEAILKDGGMVAGVAWEKGFRGVSYQLAYNQEQLSGFCQSKYLQSYIKDIYQKVERQLEKRCPILFVGLPCQIAGLRAYLGKEYKLLYTVELVCRGNLSIKGFQKYISFRKAQGINEISAVSMRSKLRGGHAQITLEIDTKDGVQHIFYAEEDPYFVSMWRGYALNNSCYDCRFKGESRMGDLSLADAWGSEFLYTDVFDDKGISHVLVNSNKGNALMEKIAHRLWIRKTDINNVVCVSKSLLTSAKRPEHRKQFYHDLDQISYEEIIDKYLKPIPKRRLATVEDAFYYQKESEQGKLLCAYGIGETYFRLQKEKILKFDYYTSSFGEDQRANQIEPVYLPYKEVKHREDIFVYITVHDYHSAKSIHEQLYKDRIPHKLFCDATL